MHVEPQPLGQKLVGNQHAVRRDDYDVGRQLDARVQPLRLQHPQAEPFGRLPGGGRLQTTTASAGSIWSRDDDVDRMETRELLEHARSERRGRGNRDAHWSREVRPRLSRARPAWAAAQPSRRGAARARHDR